VHAHVLLELLQDAVDAALLRVLAEPGGEGGQADGAVQALAGDDGGEDGLRGK